VPDIGTAAHAYGDEGGGRRDDQAYYEGLHDGKAITPVGDSPIPRAALRVE
jgi:hypothetical protein